MPLGDDRRFESPWLVAGVLAAATVVFYWRLAAGGTLYAGDIMLQFTPWREYARYWLLHNTLPLWNPLSFCGEPFFANPQTQLLYPFTWLSLWLSPAQALAAGVLVHTFLAGWMMWWCLRRLGCSGGASLLGGLVFAFSGFLVTRQQFPSLTYATAYLPGVVAASVAAVQAPSSRRGLALAALLTLQVLAGHMQMTVYTVILAAVFGAVAWKGEKAGWETLAPVLACGAALALLLSAGQWLPTLELVTHSSRGQFSYQDVARFSLPPWQMVGLVIPNFFGSPAWGNYSGHGTYWEVCGYLGILPLLLAVIGCRARTRWARLCRIAVLVGLLLATGRYGPWHRWLYDWLPPLRLFRDPARFLLIVTFCGSALAAMGLEVLLNREDGGEATRRLTRWSGWLSLSVLLLGALLVAALVIGGPLRGAWRAAYLWQFRIGDKSVAPDALPALVHGALAAAMLATVWALVWCTLAWATSRWLPRTESRLSAVAAVLTVSFADLFFFGQAFNPTIPARAWAEKATPHQPDQRVLTPHESIEAWWDRYANYSAYPSADPALLHRAAQSLTPNLNMRAAVGNVQGYNPVRLRWTDEMLHKLEEDLDSAASRRLLWRLGVSRVVSYDAEHNQPKIRRQDCGERMFVAPRVLPSAPLIDLSWGRAIVEHQDGQRLSWRVHCHDLSWLVVMDTWDVGWKADVNGVATPVDRALGAFRMVSLPAGESVVRMHYAPASVKGGIYFSLLGLLLFALGATQVMMTSREVTDGA